MLLINLGFLSYFVKKWLDNAPKEPKYPRGGEKPINDFFRSSEPGDGGRRPSLPLQAMNAGTNEVYEIGEQLLERIDRKVDVLRELIRQADTKIEAMNNTYHVLPAEMPVPESSLSAGSHDARGRNRAGAAPKNEPAAPEDDKRARIMQLRRRGLNSSQIAQEIGMGRGEVDLILNIEEMTI